VLPSFSKLQRAYFDLAHLTDNLPLLAHFLHPSLILRNSEHPLDLKLLAETLLYKRSGATTTRILTRQLHIPKKPSMKKALRYTSAMEVGEQRVTF
jgi:hypothetical protein